MLIYKTREMKTYNFWGGEEGLGFVGSHNKFIQVPKLSLQFHESFDDGVALGSDLFQSLSVCPVSFRFQNNACGITVPRGTGFG